MNLKEEVTKLVNGFIKRDEIFLVDVQIKGKKGNRKIQVFIDGDKYVDIDDCSKISKALSDELEITDIVEGRYIIEVSSPGADKALVLQRQYPKHIGKELEVLTKENKKYQGVLLNVIEDEIELSVRSGKIKKEINKASLRLSFDEIEHSKVVIRL
ncbi:MAG: hypothetical protein MI975_11430 [Cytophagales bacterium]|nr:hypothetical protein [Cytophagales bacterium]